MADNSTMFDRLNMQVPSETKRILKALAKEHGTDLAGYINAVVFHPIIQSYHARQNDKQHAALGANSGGNGSNK